MIDSNFWYGKRVFVTGHTGFKGGWISLWLISLGAIVKGFSLKPESQPNLFSILNIRNELDSQIGDIRDLEKLRRSMQIFDPDILIHMAAQPLVRTSYEKPELTYATNVMGTVNVLEAARVCRNLRAIVNVTSDKCYENREGIWGFRENEPMGGYDPYSSSKGCSELITAAYERSFFYSETSPNLATARAGNVIGGGDWSKDRLVPDILKGLESDTPIDIRYPLAKRPWQHVLEPISGYLVLVQHLYQSGKSFAGGWNFGPRDIDVKSVSWVTEKIIDLWGVDISWKDDTDEHLYEAMFLKLDCSKAKHRLGWSPTWSVQEALARVVHWQQAWLSGNNMKDLSLNEIVDFTVDMSDD